MSSLSILSFSSSVYPFLLTINIFAEWIDKSYLCHKGAEVVPSCHLVWHKIMAFKTDITTPTTTRKKAGYSHMLCYRKDTSIHEETLPDVSPRGKLVSKGGNSNDVAMT